MPRSNFSESPIYQLRVTLDMSDPLIWRKLLVPGDIGLTTLHYVLQIVMGWEDNHLHKFTIGEKEYSAPDPDDNAGFAPLLDESNYTLEQLVAEEGAMFKYEYDFGDSWVHTIVVEKIMEREKGVRYPVCTAGEMACPPEDVGGISGYHEFLKAIKDRRHPEHRELLGWVGGKFDPKNYEMEEVNLALRKMR